VQQPAGALARCSVVNAIISRRVSWRLLLVPRSHLTGSKPGAEGCWNRTKGATAFGPSKGCAMLIVVRRSNARSACSLGFKPILSKRADCRSPADGGVHAGGGVAVKKDEDRHGRSAPTSLLLSRRATVSDRRLEPGQASAEERFRGRRRSWRAATTTRMLAFQCGRLA
jgi:hypothetical protein